VVLEDVSCPECESRLAALQSDSHILMLLHNEEAAAAIRNDLQALAALKSHLERVRTRRDRVVQALKDHMRRHSRVPEYNAAGTS